MTQAKYICASCGTEYKTYPTACYLGCGGYTFNELNKAQQLFLEKGKIYIDPSDTFYPTSLTLLNTGMVEVNTDYQIYTITLSEALKMILSSSKVYFN